MSMLSAAVVSAGNVTNTDTNTDTNTNTDLNTMGAVRIREDYGSGHSCPAESLEERAGRAASRADWKCATVFQLAHVQGLGSGAGQTAAKVWFRGHFRLLRWQLSARDWVGAGDSLDRLIPPVSRAFPRSSAILGWMSLSRAVVHYQVGLGGRFRRTVAIVLWASRRQGPASLCATARGLARVERARQHGRGAGRNPGGGVGEGLARLPVSLSPFGHHRHRTRVGWRQLLELWTGPLGVKDWVDHESRDDDPESLSPDEVRSIEKWIIDFEADPEVLPAAWQVPWLARRFEAGAPRLQSSLRHRLFAAWSSVTARVSEPYSKAVALVALSEIALWCIDSESRPQTGCCVAQLRTDLGLAAGLFRRLGLGARAGTCEEQWSLLARLKMAPSAGVREPERPGDDGETGSRPLSPFPPRRMGEPLSLSSLRREVAAAGFVTHDEPLLRELGRLYVLSRSPLPVLVGGESGTGKEVIAQAIHRWSGVSGQFVPIHCGAIPRDLLESELFGHTRGAFTGATGEKPGLVEVADGGTLFLDEIGEMGPEAQMKLLRVLESGEVRRVGDTRVRRVQVRIVAATHRDLPALVTEGEFRLDLYHRIRGVETRLSPLRARRRDIVPLALHLLRPLRQSTALRLSDAAIARLLASDWPGNVRELKAVLLQAAYLSLALGNTTIEPENLGLGLVGETQPDFGLADEEAAAAAVAADALEAVVEQVTDTGLDAVLQRIERNIILRALDRSGWNRTRAAASLGGMSRTTLLSKMKRLRLTEPASGSESDAESGAESEA